MTYEEYIENRDAETTKERRYNIYRHVCYRLRERFGITHRDWNLATWNNLGFDCATRRLRVINRDKKAIFCVSRFAGQDIVWVYSRLLKCVVTVLRADEVEGKLKYMDLLRLEK